MKSALDLAPSLGLFKAEICCTLQDSTVEVTDESARVSLRPFTDLAGNFAVSDLRDPAVVRTIMLLELQAIMKGKA